MSEDTIFREVDEELRSERMRGLWRRFGPYVIGAAVAVVLLVGLNEGWQWWTNSTAARSSDQLYSAIEAAERGDNAAAQAALATSISEGSGQYPVLARFQQAALLLEEGRTADAVAAYEAIAGSTGEPSLRELALVQAGLALVDSGDVAAVEARVGGLVTSGSPMRNTAREAIGLAQYGAGELSAARQTFEAIVADPNVAPDHAGRIELYLAQLDAEGVGSTPADNAAGPAVGN